MKKSLFWADQIADEIIKQRDKKIYICAAGITPSGTVHIGNFREITTVDFVVTALKDKGKKVRFIYSWDDFDRFRKVPLNVLRRKEMKKYIGLPLNKTPDPFGCHKTYAEHFEKEFENSIKKLNIYPEFLRQEKLYSSCVYSKGIRKALLSREKIRKILNKSRKDDLQKEWWPIRIYCEKCNQDNTKVKKYDNDYKITYSCDCGFENTIDFRKKGIVKLVWRVDWPMRWGYEKVDFEPGGKEHSTPGGSRTTAVEVSKEVYGYNPPIYKMYDYIIIKGIGGKMSSSAGNVITLNDALQIYLPEIIRFLFAGTKPKKEFAVSFDEDILKIYEDFYFVERVYFGKERVGNKKKEQMERVYRFSIPFSMPKKLPVQPSFRLSTTLVQTAKNDKEAINSLIKNYTNNPSKFDIERAKKIIENAKNWVRDYAPEQYKFILNERVPANTKQKLSLSQKKSLKLLSRILEKKKYDESRLYEEFKKIREELDMKPQEFFQGAYLALLNKEQGPKLAGFILTVGQKKIVKILKTT